MCWLENFPALLSAMEMLAIHYTRSWTRGIYTNLVKFHLSQLTPVHQDFLILPILQLISVKRKDIEINEIFFLKFLHSHVCKHIHMIYGCSSEANKINLAKYSSTGIANSKGPRNQQRFTLQDECRTTVWTIHCISQQWLVPGCTAYFVPSAACSRMYHAWPQAVTLEQPWTATEPTLMPLSLQIIPAKKHPKLKYQTNPPQFPLKQQTINT